VGRSVGRLPPGEIQRTQGSARARGCVRPAGVRHELVQEAGCVVDTYQPTGEATANPTYLTLKNEFEKLLFMELGAFSYFTTNLFWFATSLSLLIMMLAGHRYTGGTGAIGKKIDYSNPENKLTLVTAFLVAEIALNLVFIFSSSFFP